MDYAVPDYNPDGCQRAEVVLCFYPVNDWLKNHDASVKGKLKTFRNLLSLKASR